MNNQHKKNRSNFSSSIGFVLAAAGSAVGLGNIWRFPYLAARNGGGTFILVYIILALTFGFALLTTEIAIGRKYKQGPLTAYGKINTHFKFLGALAWIVPVIILPYYCAIGGWAIKYLVAYASGDASAAAEKEYFTNHISSQWAPIIFLIIFLFLTSFVVYRGVNKGIEKFSKFIMPALVIIVIAIGIYALTLSYTDSNGVTRTGLEGLKVYLIPNFEGMTIKGFISLIMDAVGQLFFSISVAMGIMVAYGSYVKDDTNLMQSINRIEIFDTAIALLAGLMIIPAVFTFLGMDGMSAGPGLMFVSLPKVFHSMGFIGTIVGVAFFIMVVFAAITSSVSIMEAIVTGFMDKWKMSRKKSTVIVTIYSLIMGIIVCLGYNLLYFEITLPNGSTGQILDIMDFISNNILMTLVALLTCILIGWVAKPDIIIDEVKHGDKPFFRQKLYVIMIKYVAPVLLLILLIQAFGAF